MRNCGRRGRTWVALMSALACAVPACFAETGFVLCLTPNGHVAVEKAEDGQCASGECTPVVEATSATGRNHDSGAFAECDGCTDIPIQRRLDACHARRDYPVRTIAFGSGHPSDTPPDPPSIALTHAPGLTGRDRLPAPDWPLVILPTCVLVI